ncbi:MAG: CopD family protein, partial [Nostocoides sp.]
MSTLRPSATSSAPLPLAVGVGAVALVLAGLATAAFSPYAVSDPGGVVRWGLPLAEVVRDVAMSATIGLLGLAAFVVPERTSTDRRGLARRLAAAAAGLWTASGTLAVLLTFGDLSGTSLTSSSYWAEMSTFVLTLEFTRVLVINAAVGLVVAFVALLTRSRATTAWLVLLAMGGLVVLALTGHAAGSADHETAVNALGVHLLGTGIWVGGLIGLVALRPALGVDLGASVARYSTVALCCFVAVALSGIQQSWLRLGSLASLATAYGALIIVKALTLVVLGVLGWRQRSNLARRLGADPFDGKVFARLALTEVALMGLAIGVAMALSRSAPPVPDAAANPSRVTDLTGYPDPGPMHPSDWLLGWRPDWLLLAIAVTAVGLYAAGALRLHRRGDRWPLGRTVSWTLGWAVFVWATSGGP